MSLRTALIVLILLFLLGAFPAGAHYGFAAGGGMGVLACILLVLLLVGA